MLTRCPSCQTIFRLTSDQLLARQGRVRCGNCLHAFNALDHLAESDPKVGQPVVSQSAGSRPPAPQFPPVAAPEVAAPPPPSSVLEPRKIVTTSHMPPIVERPPLSDFGDDFELDSLFPPRSGELASAAPKPVPRPVLAPVIKKTSQRSLNDLDFSSSIDKKPSPPKPMQWTASQDFPALDIQELEPEAEEVEEIPLSLTPEGFDEPEPVAARDAPIAPASVPPPKPEAKPEPEPEPPPAPAPIPEPESVPEPDPAAMALSSDDETRLPPVAALEPSPQPPAAPQPTPRVGFDEEESAFSRIDFEDIPVDEPEAEALEAEMPKVTRDRQEQIREKPAKRAKRGKHSKRSLLPKRASSAAKHDDDAPEDENDPGMQAAAEVVDEEVLSEIFTKFGIEQKIDKIEQEINTERKSRKSAPIKDEAPPNEPEEAGHEPLPEQHHAHFDFVHGDTLSPRARAIWRNVATVLTVLLLVQSLFLFRHGISRAMPAMRPFYVATCSVLGCDMPLPRDATLVRIDDYGVLRQDDTPGHYLFYATVKNTASFVQDWPNLELTLLDITNQPLVRRVISPSEWVREEQLAKGGMPPRDTVSVRMDLEVTDVDPSNYRIDHYYP